MAQFGTKPYSCCRSRLDTYASCTTNPLPELPGKRQSSSDASVQLETKTNVNLHPRAPKLLEGEAKAEAVNDLESGKLGGEDARPRTAGSARRAASPVTRGGEEDTD